MSAKTSPVPVLTLAKKIHDYLPDDASLVALVVELDRLAAHWDVTFDLWAHFKTLKDQYDAEEERECVS